MVSPALPSHSAPMSAAGDFERARLCPKRLSHLSPVVLAGLVRLADFVTAAVSGVALAGLYHGAAEVAMDPLHVLVILLSSLSGILVLDLLGTIRSASAGRLPPQPAPLDAGVGVCFAVAGFLIFFLKAGLGILARVARTLVRGRRASR